MLETIKTLYHTCLSHWSAMSRSANTSAASFYREINPIISNIGSKKTLGVSRRAAKLDVEGPATLNGKSVFIFGRGGVPADVEGGFFDRFGLGVGESSNQDIMEANFKGQLHGSKGYYLKGAPAQYTGVGWDSPTSNSVYIIFYEPERRSRTGTSCVPISVNKLPPDFIWYIVTPDTVELRKGAVNATSVSNFASTLFSMPKIDPTKEDIDYLLGGCAARALKPNTPKDAESYLSNIGSKSLRISRDRATLFQITKNPDGFTMYDAESKVSEKLDAKEASSRIEDLLNNGMDIHFGQPMPEKYLSAYDAREDSPFVTGALKMISAEELISLAFPSVKSNSTPAEIIGDMGNYLGGLSKLFAGKNVGVFDLETTGLDPMQSQINQIAAVSVSGDGLVSGKTIISNEVNLRARLYNHTKMALAGSNSKSAIALRKQGIQLKFHKGDILSDELPLEISDDHDTEAGILKTFSDWCVKQRIGILIAHNAKFDTTMLYHRGFEIGTEIRVVDSVKMIDNVLIPAVRSLKDTDWAVSLVNGFSDKHMDGDYIRESKGRGFVSKLGVAAKALDVAPEGGYHDAIVDVRVTAQVVSKMIEKIHKFYGLAKNDPSLLSDSYAKSLARANAQSLAHGFLNKSSGNMKITEAYIPYINNRLKIGVTDPLVKSWVSLSDSLKNDAGFTNVDEFFVQHGLQLSDVVKVLGGLLEGKTKLYFTPKSPESVLSSLQSISEDLTRWLQSISSALSAGGCLHLKAKLSLKCFSLDIDKALKNINEIIDGRDNSVSLKTVVEMFQNSLQKGS